MHAGSVLLYWSKRFWAAPHVWVPVVGAIWLAAASTGLWVLWRYDNTPGQSAVAPNQWPASATLARATDRPTLVMLAHPHCTCTRASLGELAEVIARARTHAENLRPLHDAQALRRRLGTDRPVASGQRAARRHGRAR